MPAVNLSEEELVLLNNALNEILHGPDALVENWEFVARTGFERDVADKLLLRLGALIDAHE